MPSILIHGVLNKYIAAEITATIRGIPIEVRLGTAERMSKASVVNCDNLRTVARIHLVEKISKLAPGKVAEVKRAVGYALNWEELIEA